VIYFHLAEWLEPLLKVEFGVAGVPLLEESEFEAAGERPEEAALEEAAANEPKQGAC